MGAAKAIGGYIELEAAAGREYYPDALAFNSARSCLAHLIRARGIRKLCLPYFLCGSVTELCRREGAELEYYRVDRRLRPVFDRELEDGEWLYIVNYYGQLSRAELAEYNWRFGRVIADNAQAFYQRPAAGMDTIYTCRKFFGVPDGAYLAADLPAPAEYERDLSHARMAHLLGRFEKGPEEFYAAFAENEEAIAESPVLLMSELTHNLLRGIDYEQCRARRNENFSRLAEELGELNRLSPDVPDGPFMYPLLIPGGQGLRKALQKERIYIPTLWPDVLSLCAEGEWEHTLAADILPLPVDQRYTSGDMEYLASRIKALIGQEGRAL